MVRKDILYKNTLLLMNLDGNSRRNAITEYLASKASPVNGSELANMFGVSRQVIVQDIALLRAENRNILSTNKGYVLFNPQSEKAGVVAEICVKHTAEETLDELLTIVEYGGKLIDVSVEHDLYGHIRADLVINNVEDAKDFYKEMLKSKSKPLKVLTNDYHYHTISAPSEKVLKLIKQDLKEKGYLAQ